MTGSGLGFSVMAAFVKALHPAIPQFELIFFRSFINLVLVVVTMVLVGESLFKTRDRPLLLLRGLLGFGGIACLFYAVGNLPLPVAMLIGWSSPAFVILFSRIFLKERVRPEALLWGGLAFIGLLLILKIDLTSAGVYSDLPLKPVGIGLLGAAFAGLAYVTVRAATARVSVNAITLYLTGVASLISAPFAFADFRFPDGIQTLQILGMGVSATIAQYMMTQGYRFAPAPIVSAMSLMNAGFSAIIGWFVFGELLGPLQWLGMALVAAGIALIALRSAKQLR